MLSSLLDDLDKVDYIERVKTQQRNWIGRVRGRGGRLHRSKAASCAFIRTRPDTLFGATYMVMSPEHPFIEEWKEKIENYDEVMAYRAFRQQQVGL